MTVNTKSRRSRLFIHRKGFLSSSAVRNLLLLRQQTRSLVTRRLKDYSDRSIAHGAPLLYFWNDDVVWPFVIRTRELLLYPKVIVLFEYFGAFQSDCPQTAHDIHCLVLTMSIDLEFQSLPNSTCSMPSSEFSSTRSCLTNFSLHDTKSVWTLISRCIVALDEWPARDRSFGTLCLQEYDAPGPSQTTLAEEETLDRTKRAGKECKSDNTLFKYLSLTGCTHVQAQV